MVVSLLTMELEFFYAFVLILVLCRPPVANIYNVIYVCICIVQITLLSVA